MMLVVCVPLARTAVGRDDSPQCGKVVWIEDRALLAVAVR